MTPVSPVLTGAAGLSDDRIAEVVYAKGQPQYRTLPALKSCNGRVTTRWRLSLKERLQVLFAGNIYLQVLAFGGDLQPLKLLADEPSIDECL